MAWSGKNIIITGSCLILSIMVSGCTTLGRKVDVIYQPVVQQGAGGNGPLYLAVRNGQQGFPAKNDLQWIVGKVMNTDGEKTGDIVMTTATDILVVDAFKQELSRAGYKLVPVAALTEEVAKGVNVAGMTVELEETSDLVKSEGVIRLWKNGKKFKKLDYQSMLSDFAVKNRDQLLSTLLQNSLQEIMKQAIPEIVKALES
jgi:hypothetical protein